LSERALVRTGRQVKPVHNGQELPAGWQLISVNQKAGTFDASSLTSSMKFPLGAVPMRTN
jgi:hypothetical protein